jgi:hypothetical protein
MASHCKEASNRRPFSTAAVLCSTALRLYQQQMSVRSKVVASVLVGETMRATGVILILRKTRTGSSLFSDDSSSNSRAFVNRLR